MTKAAKSIAMMKALPSNISYDQMNSPVGSLTLIASDRALHAIAWENDWEVPEFVEIMQTVKKNSKHAVLQQTKEQLKEYFAGKRRDFDLPLEAKGTDFQKKAWRKLVEIPFGKTISYQQQAIELGDKNKVRAVGAANGRNPLSIVVPCHRVVAKTGALHGFGGGLSIKKFLLEHEQKHC